jgi:hypothetical protein
VEGRQGARLEKRGAREGDGIRSRRGVEGEEGEDGVVEGGGEGGREGGGDGEVAKAMVLVCGGGVGREGQEGREGGGGADKGGKLEGI